MAARVIGFLTFEVPDDAPALRSLPLIMDASFSTFPSLLNTLPLPALNSGESSKILIVSMTAISLDSPFFNNSHPFEIASSSLLIIESSFDLEIFSFSIIPAPP